VKIVAFQQGQLPSLGASPPQKSSEASATWDHIRNEGNNKGGHGVKMGSANVWIALSNENQKIPALHLPVSNIVWNSGQIRD
jgi:chitinase